MLDPRAPAHEQGPRIIAAGEVPGPPAPPYAEGRAYPLAFDVDGRIAAVTFAQLNMYPDIATGWWCEAVTFSRRDDGAWHHAGGESDNTTAPDPFSRPARATNSEHDWCDWHSNGGLGDWDDDEPRLRTTFFGIAPIGTARLTVTDETGRTRDLRITPWNGAYVAIVAGERWTLTGYDATGEVLGSIMPMDDLEEPDDPEPPPGWRRDPERWGLFVRDDAPGGEG